MMAKEEWKPISGWDGYEVSNIGRVRSFKRPTKNRAWVADYSRPPKILSHSIVNGYRGVILSQKGKGRKSVFINTLVLEAFVCKRPSKNIQACHNDGNKQNNNVKNLRWDTPKNNNKDKIKHGTHQHGELIGTAKLTNEEADEIRKLRLMGEKCKDLAYQYNVCRNTITNITSGCTYKNEKKKK